MKLRRALFPLLGLSLSAAAHAATAATVSFDVTYDIEFASGLAQGALGFEEGDVLQATVAVGEDRVPSTGTATVAIREELGDDFRIGLGTVQLAAADDDLGAPEIDFLDGVPAALFFDGDFAVGEGPAEIGFTLSLGTNSAGIGNFFLSSEFSEIEASGVLSGVTPSPVPLPGAVVFMLSALGLLGVGPLRGHCRRRRNSVPTL